MSDKTDRPRILRIFAAMKKKQLRKWLKRLFWLLASPIILFLVLAILIYLPPVQRWAVGLAADKLSEETGMKITVGDVRLAFPLDLALHDVTAIDGRDTVMAMEAMRLDIRLLPLFEGRADIDGFSLYKAKVNTKSFVADTYIRGHIDRLTAKSHGVEWGTGKVRLDEATLDGAQLFVAMSDTAKVEPDTTEATPWFITADEIRVKNTSVSLSMPGDSLRLFAHLGDARLSALSLNTAAPSVTLNTFDLKDGAITYATRGGKGNGEKIGNTAFMLSGTLLWQKFIPADGLDPNCLSIDGLRLKADSLNYANGTLKVNLRQLQFKERSGLEVKEMAGRLYMDSTRLSLPGLTLRTAHSRVTVQADLGLKAFDAHPDGALSLHIDADIAPQDIKTGGRGFVPDDLLKVWPNTPLAVEAEMEGNLAAVSLRSVAVRMPGVAGVSLRGHGEDLASALRKGQVHFAADVTDFGRLKAFLPQDVAGSFDIPRGTSLTGDVKMDGDQIGGGVKLLTAGGQATVQGRLNTKSEQYDIDLKTTNLPLGRLLPTSGLSPLTASVKATGRGFDMMARNTRLHADANISRFALDHIDLSGITADATLSGGEAVANFQMATPIVEGNGQLKAQLGREIFATLTADLPEVNLQRIASLKDTLNLGVACNLDLKASDDFTDLRLGGALENIRFLTPQRSIPAKDLLFDLTTNRDTTEAHINAGDLTLALNAHGTIDRITSGLAAMGGELSRQMTHKIIDLEAIKAKMPTLSFSLEAGADNPLSKIMLFKGIGYRSADVRLATSPTDGLTGDLHLGAFKNGGILLDTVCLALRQDTAGLKMDGEIKNFTKKNPNHFTLQLASEILPSEANVHMAFLDEAGRKGIDLGLKAEAPGGDYLALSLFPHHPIIAYRNFTVNDGNFIKMERDGRISADVQLLADDGTGLNIYGQPTDSLNDLTLSIASLNLGELSSVMPYLPQMRGKLYGDFHVMDHFVEKSLSAAGSFSIDDFVFEGTALGDLGLEAFYLPKADGEHYANAYISAGGSEVLQCEGTYKDDQFEGQANLLDCPLKLLNGFMADAGIGFKGTAGGELSLSGTTDRMTLNGQIDLDSARIFSDTYGFDFGMDERPIVIQNSRLQFDDYRLTSKTDKNPLVMNGYVDMADFSRMRLDFDMKARNFELINTKRTPSSLLFGKVYADFDGRLYGLVDQLTIRGNLSVLDRTDMTYILKDSPLTVEDQLSGLVTFTDFSDTIKVDETEATATSGFDLTLGINISDAARFCCNLSEDGSNYVNLEGGGDLTMRITHQGDLRLTGRLTAQSGKMKYSLPIIPLKTFDIAGGSYVEFTGDPANPTLNISATETMRTTITENDQPRAVTFKVGVDITKPLSDMGLAFTIEAPDDLSMQNQLVSMSPEQRNKAAIAMLATGMFMTDEMMTSGGSGFKASNALNAFLQSEIQNIAGNALRTFDISVGMENSTSETGTTTTDYSFRFAKRFWNNRISVILGGKVSTGQDAQNTAASFIDNVAVEYRLDQSATRYVKVFYDRSAQDPLEGQLTQTGAGLILRRKTDRLGELFIFKRKPKDK